MTLKEIADQARRDYGEAHAAWWKLAQPFYEAGGPGVAVYATAEEVEALRVAAKRAEDTYSAWLHATAALLGIRLPPKG